VILAAPAATEPTRESFYMEKTRGQRAGRVFLQVEKSRRSLPREE